MKGVDCWPWKVHCLNPCCVLQSLTDDGMSRQASPAAGHNTRTERGTLCWYRTHKVSDVPLEPKGSFDKKLWSTLLLGCQLIAGRYVK